MEPTIHDVAKLANTSKSTVSRYLNGYKIKQATQEAIDKAIQELNYHRNINARRLVMNKTYTIGIVVDDISNIFYSGIIKGIESVAGKNNYNCIFLSWTSNHDKEISFLHLLYEGQVDGLIMVSFRKRDHQDLIQFRDAPYPISLIGDHGELDGIFSVDVDNAAGISDVIAYLHSNGHRKIAYISGPENMSASKYRYKGYCEALEKFGLEYNANWVIQSDWSNQAGYSSMEQLLSEDGITAIVASSDEVAIGALRAAQEHGKQVPKDLSIVGFDDVTVASWVFPALTSVRQPFRDIGTMAAEGLFRKIKGEEEQPSSHLLKPTLIVRDSCGKIF